MSMVLGGMSFVNALDTVMEGVNQNLYFQARFNSRITALTDTVTFGVCNDSNQGVDSTRNMFYLKTRTRDFAVRIPDGEYTPQSFASILEQKLQEAGCAVLVTWTGPDPIITESHLAFVRPPDTNEEYFVPPDKSLNAYLRPTGQWASVLGVRVAFRSAEQVLRRSIARKTYERAEFVAALQEAIRTAVPSAQLTDSPTGFEMKSERFFLRFFGLSSLNRFLGPTTPSKQQFVELKWPLTFVESYVTDMTPGFYNGDEFASELQDAINRFVPASVRFLEGKLEIDTGDDSIWLFFPSAEQLRTKSWKRDNWNGDDYDTFNPRSINGALNSWRDFARLTQTGFLYLQTCRELFVHCSLSSYSALSPSGQYDVIARVPVEAAPGELVFYRPFTNMDSEAVRMTDGALRTLRLTLTDAYNVPIPLPHYVSYEITFVSTPF
jgi:hypothetical protein